jgi:hypothetical protein
MGMRLEMVLKSAKQQMDSRTHFANAELGHIAAAVAGGRPFAETRTPAFCTTTTTTIVTDNE